MHQSAQHEGYWRQRADDRLGDPPANVQPGASSGQTGMENPQEDLMAVHCFCVCGGIALFVDLLGVSRCCSPEFLSPILS